MPRMPLRSWHKPKDQIKFVLDSLERLGANTRHSVLQNVQTLDPSPASCCVVIVPYRRPFGVDGRRSGGRHFWLNGLGC